MNPRIYIIILASSLSLMILGAIVGGILESSGTVTRASLGSRGVTIIMGVYGVLFFLAAFALVPLALRFFISMQIKIGNGEFFIIKWLQTHEATVVFCFWGMFILGLGIAFALTKDDILKGFKAR